MLKSLFIKNFVLIDEIHVEFGPGLNILTGETGAGKSIVVGALGALLGESMTRDLVRKGEAKAVFEAEIDVKLDDGMAEYLQSNEVDLFGEQLVIRRELHDSGRSRSFINDTPVQLKILATLGDWLVDLHGQHDHQQLLKSSRHVDYLDAFAGIEDQTAKLKLFYQQLKAEEKDLHDLLAQQDELEKSQQILEFQLREITSVDPRPDEEDELVQEEHILRNAEVLFEKTNSLYHQLYEGEGAVSEILTAAAKNLHELGEIDSSFEGLQKECDDALLQINDISDQLQKYNSQIVFDPNRLEEIRQRLAALNGLKKKYGGTLQAVLQQKADIEQRLSLIENLDDAVQERRDAIEATRNILADIVQTVSRQRQQIASELDEKISAELARLGMTKARFQVRIQQRPAAENSEFVILDGEKWQVGQKGIDSVEFLVAANPGEPLKPLPQVASGGEISRIMLALKSLLAEADRVPVLIFDEIDAGISGRVAQAVGVSMRKLASTHQILAITHLPQIASMAHQHFAVEKQSDADSTTTRLRQLNTEERYEHIAGLFGGETVTDAHLASARQLIQEAESLAPSS